MTQWFSIFTSSEFINTLAKCYSIWKPFWPFKYIVAFILLNSGFQVMLTLATKIFFRWVKSSMNSGHCVPCCSIWGYKRSLSFPLDINWFGLHIFKWTVFETRLPVFLHVTLDSFNSFTVSYYTLLKSGWTTLYLIVVLFSSVEL